jgi:hypothetical protein
MALVILVAMLILFSRLVFMGGLIRERALPSGETGRLRSVLGRLPNDVWFLVVASSFILLWFITPNYPVEVTAARVELAKAVGKPAKRGGLRGFDFWKPARVKFRRINIG